MEDQDGLVWFNIKPADQGADDKRTSSHPRQIEVNGDNPLPFLLGSKILRASYGVGIFCPHRVSGFIGEIGSLY